MQYYILIHLKVNFSHCQCSLKDLSKCEIAQISLEKCKFAKKTIVETCPNLQKICPNVPYLINLLKIMKTVQMEVKFCPNIT